MTREDFIEQYCQYCGSQRCYGEEYCGKYRELVLGEQPLIPKFCIRQYIYRYDEEKHYISIYCDGWLTEKRTIVDDSEVNNFLNRLEKEGYTMAFTDEDIESALAQYEYVLANRLIKKEK